ncbi:hypothetical protein LCGC14_0334940 [marine sediment metagenome]|uniref:Uncharacterized protein n=1 Tax=marine sediment metagenome TaxID=412755 RepID=A0A0F9W2V0_9ZZZZ
MKNPVPMRCARECREPPIIIHHMPGRMGRGFHLACKCQWAPGSERESNAITNWNGQQSGIVYYSSDPTCRHPIHKPRGFLARLRSMFR